MSVSRIVPNISSADPAASKPFYEGVLGLDIAMDMGWIMTFASPSNPMAQVSVVASVTRAEPHPISASRWPTSMLVMPLLSSRAIR
jgi:hypothetical protein